MAVPIRVTFLFSVICHAPKKPNTWYRSLLHSHSFFCVFRHIFCLHPPFPALLSIRDGRIRGIKALLFSLVYFTFCSNRVFTSSTIFRGRSQSNTGFYNHATRAPLGVTQGAWASSFSSSGVVVEVLDKLSTTLAT